MYGTFYELTRPNILARVSEFEIFRHYIPWFEAGKSIKTPFKNEDHPSFWSHVNHKGEIYFKDFGRGYHGDCFDLVGYLFNCNFIESLNIINKDMDLGLGIDTATIKDVKWHLRMQQREKVIAEETDFIHIEYRERTWTNLDTHFWIGHGVLPKIRIRLGIVAIDGFWVGRTYHYADTLAYAWRTANGRVKIYQPLNKRELKWRSNTSNESLQGEHVLPPTGELLLFQSSQKDIGTVMSRYNIPAVAPNGEHGNIPKEKLEDYEHRFNRLGIMYDNDPEGIKAMRRMHEEFGYEMFILPQPTIGITDPSDFISHGYSMLLDIFFEYTVNYK